MRIVGTDMSTYLYIESDIGANFDTQTDMNSDTDFFLNREYEEYYYNTLSKLYPLSSLTNEESCEVVEVQHTFLHRHNHPFNMVTSVVNRFQQQKLM